jgi:hypothetical protein
MYKQKAEQWVEELTNLLSGRQIVSVAVGPGERVDVRLEQEFKRAYFVEHQRGNCTIALADSYGVMTGASRWRIDPDRRSVHAYATNGFGEPLQWVWTVADDVDGTVYRSMLESQRRLWQ